MRFNASTGFWLRFAGFTVLCGFPVAFAALVLSWSSDSLVFAQRLTDVCAECGIAALWCWVNLAASLAVVSTARHRASERWARLSAVARFSWLLSIIAGAIVTDGFAARELGDWGAAALASAAAVACVAAIESFIRSREAALLRVPVVDAAENARLSQRRVVS